MRVRSECGVPPCPNLTALDLGEPPFAPSPCYLGAFTPRWASEAPNGPMPQELRDASPFDGSCATGGIFGGARSLEVRRASPTRIPSDRKDSVTSSLAAPREVPREYCAPDLTGDGRVGCAGFSYAAYRASRDFQALEACANPAACAAAERFGAPAAEVLADPKKKKKEKKKGEEKC